MTAAHAGETLRLETAAYPVPVKKQRKYNLTRWAVTGRDDIAINAACQRIYAALKRAMRPMPTGGNLCRLWASDFRTHITETRWQVYCRDLAAMEARLGTGAASALPAPRRTRRRPSYRHRNAAHSRPAGPPARPGHPAGRLRARISRP